MSRQGGILEKFCDGCFPFFYTLLGFNSCYGSISGQDVNLFNPSKYAHLPRCLWHCGSPNYS